MKRLMFHSSVEMRCHTDENHQDKANSQQVTIENKLWLPPSFTNNIAPIAPVPKKRGINWGFADRPVFDWTILVSQVLGAIAIPFVVTVIGLYATQQITEQQTLLSERQHQTDIQIALDQQRETTLKTCMDDIKDLLLNKGLRESNPGDEVRVVARAEVLSALRQMDGERKGVLIRFLSEAMLITDTVVLPLPGTRNNVIIGLSFADLTSADMKDADLVGADLVGAHMSGADLSGAYLKGANLLGADLSGAHLNGVNLTFGDLTDAKLGGADLSDTELGGADLSGVNLVNTHLTRTYLKGARMMGANLTGAHLIGYDLTGADLSYAQLGGAYLGGADLSSSNLTYADLTGAHLIGADLNGSNLTYADLTDATVTNEQLAQATSLKGATMPDGSIHP